MNEPRPNDTPDDPTEGLAQETSESADPTPDAVKASPDLETEAPDTETPTPDAGGETPDDRPTHEGIPINEPTMDFSQPVSVPDEVTEAHRAEFPRFGDGAAGAAPRNMDLLLDVKLPVAIELGRTTLPISDILEWTQGSVIELDKLAGEPVDLLVNNKLVARGEVVVIDEKFGLRITALLATPDAPAAE